MSDHTILNNSSQVFQSNHMAERQSSTNTTCNKSAIDNNTQFTINNITIPQNQQFINMPFIQPLVLPPPPPPPAAFQIQPIVHPNVPQKLNPSAPTFTPNPLSNVPNVSVQGYQNQLQAALAKLQILSIQLSTLQLINQQNPTVESLNQYQTVYQQYNNEFANTLLLNQLITNLNNLAINNQQTQNNSIANAAPVTAVQSLKKGQLETIEEGENENEEQIDENNDKIAPMDKNEGTKVTKQIGEQLADTKPVKNLWKFPNGSNYGFNDTTDSTAVFGEQQSKKKSELERIKKQIRCILNKITAENFDKLSQEIASILKVSDIALIELNNSRNNKLSAEELYMFEKAQFKALIKLILKCILDKAINETLFTNQYARLCYSLYLYAENNELKKKLFRQQLLSICHSIFKKTLKNGENNKFIGIITMIGELFKFGLVSWNVIYSGIFEELLPPQNSIDIEGICKLLKTAGSDFDRHHYKEINIIINSLSKYSEKFDFRSKCFVRDICEMRGNDWKLKNNIKTNSKPKPLKQIHKEFYNENKNHKNKKKYYNNNNGQRNNNRQWRNNNRYNNSYNNSYNSYNNNSYNSYNNSNNRRKQRNLRPTVEFVKDVTLKDRSHYAPNKILTKTWSMRNSGEMSWGDNVELVYFKGDTTLSLEQRYPVTNASPGHEVQISATIKTPQQPGRYCTYFRLQKNAKFFGPRVWVDIIVNDNIAQQTSFDGRNNCATNYEANNKILYCQ